MQISVILAAAGSGTRMGYGKSKALLPLLDRPALDYCLALFAAQPAVRQIIVAAPKADIAAIEAICAPYALVQVIAGGADRCASVEAALAACSPAATHIAVHDAARPLLHAEDWSALLLSAEKEQAAVLASAPVDTVQQVSDGYICGHLQRDALAAIQTPQVFRAQLLRTAYALAGPAARSATDDAALVARLGAQVAVIWARHENFKLTYAADLAAAEAVLRRRKQEESR